MAAGGGFRRLDQWQPCEVPLAWRSGGRCGLPLACVGFRRLDAVPSSAGFHQLGAVGADAGFRRHSSVVAGPGSVGYRLAIYKWAIVSRSKL